MKSPDAEKALHIYYTKTEIGSADIRRLFDCSASTATRLKKEVAKEMAKNQVRTWLPGNVSVRVAYEVWLIDVAELEKKLVKLQKLRNLGIFN